MLTCLEETAEKPNQNLTCLGVVLWYIWIARNDARFNGKSQDPRRTLRGIRSTVRLMHEGTLVQARGIKTKIAIGWTPPPQGSLKLDIDGSALNGCGAAGDGCLEEVKVLLSITTSCEDIKLLLQSVEYAVCRNHREANYGADALANFASSLAHTWDWLQVSKKYAELDDEFKDIPLSFWELL
ncbi:hypothetical protein IFM89_001875 [Coptis chinensis]|uniref:RNase H type-1 domain-containing protein n=1 Tax=Coptis chinensis TaxID=261450 RepID=A0A835M987_9MAGN|nr:hypothetical protein IFM89_001875 [Coptis chinensis]